MASQYQKALDALAERGYKGARVVFDGGNDSGGPNYIELIRLSDSGIEGCDWSDSLYGLLAEPVYDRYFYVDGSVTFDVTEGTVIMNREESESVWRSYVEDL